MAEGSRLEYACVSILSKGAPSSMDPAAAAAAAVAVADIVWVGMPLDCFPASISPGVRGVCVMPAAVLII